MDLMSQKYKFKNGVELEIKDGETFFDALYRFYCWNCERAVYCHNACSEFDDRCENIEEVLEMMDELGVDSL